MRIRSLVVALLSILLAPPLAAPLRAQLEPPSTGGAVALDHELRMLGHYKRVLMIGAHPDDEDTELLTILVRGMGAEAAYLSLNRGEGGQNLLGPELGEALGLIRTEELLAARQVDGARQYFTRAYDFGFSKTLDDTWAHWPRDSVLKDVVRIVRQFRPQVIVSVFSGTPRDGHGQHQAAGWAAMEAFRIAGDSSRFPELEATEGLPAWMPLKLYRSTRFDTAATTLTLQGGELDAAVGKSFHQIAMASRSRHRSQDMGRLQDIGPSSVRVALIEDRTRRGTDGLFAGVDTSLAAMPPLSGRATLLTPAMRRLLARHVALVDSARRLDGSGDRSAERRILESARRALFDAFGSAEHDYSPAEEGPIETTDQFGHLDRAIAALRGLVFDATLDDDRVVPGQTLTLTLTAWNASPDSARLGASAYSPVWGWSDSLSGAHSAPGRSRWRDVPPGALTTWEEQVTIPADARPSTPYFVRPPHSAMYTRLPQTGYVRWGAPFDPPPLQSEFRADAPAALSSIGVTREVTVRLNDQAVGEVRRPVVVVPRIGVRIEPDTIVWVAGQRGPRRFTVTLAHGGRDTVSGRVALELPSGWRAPAAQSFRFTREDEQRDFVFSVEPPATLAPGSYPIRAVADAGGERYDLGLYTISYPHIRPRSYAVPSEARVVVAPLALPKLARVGYVRGASDRIPEALRSVGVPVELLDARALERGDLSRYDAIVVGPRAYETDRALVANNDRLFEYARGGGLLIVQYQQYQFVRGGYAPYPLTIASPHDRVTDENAAVTALEPGSPILTGPNRIGADDWRGWVQERGLYFAHTWAPEYRPVLSMHDPDEPPLTGGLLVAPVGKGRYVYTGLSFFRQLPAGVPGAFRLFLNLLALPPAPSP